VSSCAGWCWEVGVLPVPGVGEVQQPGLEFYHEFLRLQRSVQYEVDSNFKTIVVDAG
jgi:hypothetical protein